MAIEYVAKIALFRLVQWLHRLGLIGNVRNEIQYIKTYCCVISCKYNKKKNRHDHMSNLMWLGQLFFAETNLKFSQYSEDKQALPEREFSINK
jgi:hypothetical protein